VIYYVTVESDSFVSTNFDNCDGTYLLLIRKLKVHMQHYANEPLLQVRLSFQKLLQIRLTCRNNKNVLGNEWWCVLVDKSTDHVKPHFTFHFTFHIFLFFNTKSMSKKFSQGTSWKRHLLRDTTTRLSNRSSTVQIVQYCCIFVCIFDKYIYWLSKYIYWLSS